MSPVGQEKTILAKEATVELCPKCIGKTAVGQKEGDLTKPALL